MNARIRACGFTLLELMVVLVILAVLAAIAIPAYGNYIVRSKIRVAQADLLALSAVVENHRQRTLLYPTGTLTSTAAVSGRFKAWTPASKPADFTFSYATDASGYLISATGAGARLAGCSVMLNGANVRVTAGCPNVGSLTW
jgi:type IV pilus assembly protein PilE